MAKDKYGFDSDETYTQEDNPFWDATDAAHRAWWRGQEYTERQMTKQLNAILFGKEKMTFQQIKNHLRKIK